MASSDDKINVASHICIQKIEIRYNKVFELYKPNRIISNNTKCFKYKI